MRAGWIGLGALALLAACQDRNPSNNEAGANGADPRPIGELAKPPVDLANEESAIVEDLVAEVPSPATIPAAFQGRWASDRSKCGDGQESGLTITPKMLRFYESEAKVKSVDATGPRAITVAASFIGEGQSWEDSQRLSLSENGQMLTIAGKNVAIRRTKCS